MARDMGRRVAVALGTALALAGWTAAAEQQLPRASPVCAALTVSSTPELADQAQRKGYSARAILDLNLTLTLGDGPVPETLKLKLFTPAGHLYQEIDVPVAPEGSAEATRALPGYQFPVKVAPVRTRKSEAGATRTIDTPPFPVAGTNIVANSLYGRWRAEAWLAGAGEACQAEFTVLP